jgi:hypothetical protein
MRLKPPDWIITTIQMAKMQAPISGSPKTREPGIRIDLNWSSAVPPSGFAGAPGTPYTHNHTSLLLRRKPRHARLRFRQPPAGCQVDISMRHPPKPSHGRYSHS